MTCLNSNIQIYYDSKRHVATCILNGILRGIMTFASHDAICVNTPLQLNMIIHKSPLDFDLVADLWLMAGLFDLLVDDDLIMKM